MPSVGTCPACQGKVSRATHQCPHCGQPLTPTEGPAGEPLPPNQQRAAAAGPGQRSSVGQGIGVGFGGCLGVIIFIIVLLAIGQALS